MLIAVAKETKKHEYRVGATPACVGSYVRNGHSVIVQKGAGEGTGYSDAEYRRAGATIEPDAAAVFSRADMVVKVKEPQPEEIDFLRKGQILFTYLHLASDRNLTESLIKTEVTAVAYETIQLSDGSLPCLSPMSEIAGRLSIQEGAKYLEKAFGGRGILLGGVPGVRKGNVAILGGGVVGINAAKMAIGIGADVNILDVSHRRLAYLDDIFGPRVQTLFSNDTNVYHSIVEADLVVGAVLVPGAAAPKLILKEHLRDMKKGSVIVDVAVDQGGCAETTRPTTHDDPIFVVDGVVHYCVANMPGVVALTSTLALTNQTLPYGLELADKGFEDAVSQNQALRRGVNLWRGRVTCQAVADSLGLEYSRLP